MESVENGATLAPVRARFVLLVAGIAVTLGCGDGVGRPLVESELEEPEAGASGTAGSGGDSSRGGYPGFGGRGASFGGSGSSGRWGSGGWGGTASPDACAGTEGWPQELVYSELGLLDFLNLLRQVGFDCGTGVMTAAAPALVMKPELQCAARRHSRDMAERGFFSHDNPDGWTPEDRMRNAGYVTFGITAESIAQDGGAGETTAMYRAVADLLSAGGTECENLVDASFDSVGIGHFEDLWTVDLAGP
jgi:hypothetical protein